MAPHLMRAQGAYKSRYPTTSTTPNGIFFDRINIASAPMSAEENE